MVDFSNFGDTASQYDSSIISTHQRGEDRLQKLANRTGRTKRFYLTEAICEYLDDVDELEILKQRLEELQAGKVKSLTLVELIAKHGVDP